MEMKRNSARKEWVDVLRALAMILVIYGHLLSGYSHSSFYIITSPIKIPLFFAISGYVFNKRNGDTKSFFINLLKKLVVPFLFFSVVLMPFKLLAAYKELIDHSVNEVLYSFLTGNELWYLPCCIVAETIFFFACKFAKKDSLLIISCLGISCIGFIMCKYHIMNIANVNTAFTAQLYLIVGYVCRANEERINSHKFLPFLFVFLYSALCFISLMAFPNQYIDVHKNIYYCLPLNLAMIIVGNSALFSTFSIINVKSPILSFIGKNTIVYYVIHEYVVGVLRVLIHKCKINGSGTYLFEFFNLIIICTVCAVASLVINKVIPFSVGKKRI